MEEQLDVSLNTFECNAIMKTPEIPRYGGEQFFESEKSAHAGLAML